MQTVLTKSVPAGEDVAVLEAAAAVTASADAKRELGDLAQDVDAEAAAGAKRRCVVC